MLKDWNRLFILTSLLLCGGCAADTPTGQMDTAEVVQAELTRIGDREPYATSTIQIYDGTGSISLKNALKIAPSDIPVRTLEGNTHFISVSGSLQNVEAYIVVVFENGRDRGRAFEKGELIWDTIDNSGQQFANIPFWKNQPSGIDANAYLFVPDTGKASDNLGVLTVSVHEHPQSPPIYQTSLDVSHHSVDLSQAESFIVSDRLDVTFSLSQQDEYARPVGVWQPSGQPGKYMFRAILETQPLRTTLYPNQPAILFGITK